MAFIARDLAFGFHSVPTSAPEHASPAESGPRAAASPVNSGEVCASNRLAREAEAELDRGLIQRAQNGDSRAFRALVERHQRRAFVIAVALVKDEEDAREVVQEAFLRVHRGLAQFQGGSSFFTWLYRIVTNLAIDVVRRPARRELGLEETLENATEEELLLGAEADDPFAALERSELRRRIARALDELPPYHRGVIVMRELQGMSYEEMAQAMGVSKGTIMSRLFHARRKLERALVGDFGGPATPGDEP
ncbi:MAG TPA: sigma-70 family RNA polymerase sigma factor [Polyangiaceae bacterium]|nr:sigma-70 family RNA polymerase sigma factor [Polyangiaceae bacterium]